MLGCERTSARRWISSVAVDSPSKDALKFAFDLRDIRKGHAAWLSSEIEEKLTRFEGALNRIGSGMVLLDSVPVGERRSRVVEEIYKAFSTLLGVEKPARAEVAEIVAARIIVHLRDVLGVKPLTTLRQHIARLALRRAAQGDVSSRIATMVAQPTTGADRLRRPLTGSGIVRPTGNKGLAGANGGSMGAQGRPHAYL